MFKKYAQDFIYEKMGTTLAESFIDFKNENDLFENIKLFCLEHSLNKNEFLENFGQFLILCFIRDYNSFFSVCHNTLTFLKTVQPIIHREVNRIYNEARPPVVLIREITKNRYIVKYSSDRKLISLLKGMIFGVADYYSEAIKIAYVSSINESDVPTYEFALVKS